MDVGEKILKDLETPEGLAKMHNWLDKYAKKEKDKYEKIKIMMSNTNYLEWLNQFTQDKNGFYDDDWQYSPDLITESDKENVEKLGLFYEGIEKYATSNYISPSLCEFGNFYKIRLDEKGFEIGFLIGQGTVFFCKKVAVENKQEFIDINDIITGKKQEKTDKINASLETLSNMVLTAYENGVPIESIVYTLDNTIEKIISQNQDNSKTGLRK